ncbi:hypothetical protein FE257_009912 [Aspergillus nanangensis]|uniref:INO80 complex subunit F domain-containing protein n=1 Tax=Aspergillus nanangensis TaxID=2582783 RepID=A0AAD4GY96_ASPNN|nr:hypothetical protein FE257_009912 [Aspergillus nanangensis]
MPSTNPPSVEVAYKRKCIALKKRLSEIEAENEIMRVRNNRGRQYIHKMRLESCILLERLAKVTGMVEEAQSGARPDLHERAVAMMSNVKALNDIAGPGGEGSNNKRDAAYYEDETEGSSEEQPPTPQERPLRAKRSRKSNTNQYGGDDDEPASTTNAPEASGSRSDSLPHLAPAPTQEEMTSSFRLQAGNGGSAEKDSQPANESNASERGSQNPESGPGDRTMEASAEPTTPMDMDAKEPKEES